MHGSKEVGNDSKGLRPLEPSHDSIRNLYGSRAFSYLHEMIINANNLQNSTCKPFASELARPCANTCVYRWVLLFFLLSILALPLQAQDAANPLKTSLLNQGLTSSQPVELDTVTVVGQLD